MDEYNEYLEILKFGMYGSESLGQKFETEKSN